MLFRLEFTVAYADGSTATVTTRPATDVAFERKFGRSLVSLFTDVPVRAGSDAESDEQRRAMLRWFAEQLTAEHTYFLAWHASRDARDFDTWLDGVVSINWQIDRDSGASQVTVDPTSPAQPGS